MITLYDENNVQIRDIRIYEINDADMGESTITATVKFDQVMQFHPDWYVLLNGEKYKLGVTEPAGKRSTTRINVEYTLTFHSSREDLKRYTFMDFVEYGSGNPQPSQHTFSLQACTLGQLVNRFNINLLYYLGSLWTMELSDDADPTVVADLTFDKASLWDVLLGLYDKYGVRWTIRNNNGTMTIVVGKEATELQTIFEYGNGNGLISVERTNPMERIVTRLRGKGSERNLPANYFHAATSAFPIGDPDTNSILQGIYYNRLYPKCYRDYVRGYNSGQSQAGESWAYQQGVADKIAGRPMNIVDFAKSDKEALWGISYGAIEDNDAIYPTLQGARRDGVELDRVLAVSPIYIDSPDDEARAEQFTQVNGAKGSFQGRDTHITFNGHDGGITSVTGIGNAKSATADSDTFTLETAFNTVKAKFLVTPTKVADFFANTTGLTDPISPVLITVAEMAANHWNFIERIQLINVTTDVVLRTWDGNNQDFFDVVADDIPAGTYKFRSYIQWYKSRDYLRDRDKLLYTIDWQLYGCEFAAYQNASSKMSFSETFDIWVGNVWNTSKQEGESDEAYAYRVWAPLVSREEMTVMFSDGLLAGEDYEFPIVGLVTDSDNLAEVIKKAIHYDTSVTGSHWRLTLQKSDAEFEASGKYLPNSVINVLPGNHFFFINIQMPYDPYIYDAERRQQEYLEDKLSLLDVEQPTFAVVPSSVFMASLDEVDDVVPGNKIRLRDVSLIGSSYTTAYIQSISKRYTENKINPDWSLVVSDQIIVSGNPISLIDGKVEALSRQMYSSKQATRDAIEAMSQFYLRKDGIADISFSRTDFRAPVSLHDRLADYNFRQGDFGGFGFGIYTDPDGNRVVEADVLVGRTALRVNELVVNQVDYVGGQKIYSAAAMTISKVESTSTVWRCYFDSKQGTVRNMFLAGDLAFCQRFKGTEEGGYTTYWAKVVAIGSDYIEISKTDIMSSGSGSPSVGDNVIQLGNASDQDRQSAIILSSYGANSPSLRLYHGINEYSLNNKDMFGVEYDSVNQIPYFYNYGSMRLGARTDEEGGFITYDHISKQLNIKAVVNFLPQSTGLEQMEAYQKLVQIAQGNIETWFYDDITPAQTGAPTLTNYPINSWEVADYENHIGDIYYSDTGKGYRFKRSGNGWAWEIISDAELAQIMAEVQNLQYIKAALNQDTVVAGGLILTSLIQLGYKDTQDVRHIMAGISGLGQDVRGIAAWFGGPMVDHELNPAATDYAKSLFRFDGTGYLAKGNITWDSNGYGQVGGSGDNYAVKWDASGVRLGNGVYIGSDGDETLGTILTLLNKFDSWFGIDTAGNIFVKKDGNGNARNFYSFGEITAGGVGEDAPVVSTTLGGLLNVVDAADDVQTTDKILVRRANASGANSWTLADLSDISGTVVGIRMNGTVKSPGTDKIVDLGTVLTEQSLAAYRTSAAQDVIDNLLAKCVQSLQSQIDSVASKTDSDELIALKTWIESMFEKDTTSIPGQTLIKAKFSLYTEGELTAGGVGAGGGGGGASNLYQLEDVPDYRSLRNKVMKVNASGQIVWENETSGTITGAIMNDSPVQVSSGILQLGTVLREHQSLAAYRTASAQDAIDDILGKCIQSLQSQIDSVAAKTAFDDEFIATSLYADTLAASSAYFGSISVEGGIPSTALASGVQTALGKANAAYQKPASGIPYADLASGVQTSLGKADTAYNWGDWHSSMQAVESRAATLEGYFTEGSAKKALQLTTARTIWGQSFNGTANINGDMSSVGRMTFAAKTSAATSGNILEVVTLNGVTYLHTTLPFYSDNEITAGGIGSGSGGGGLIQTVYGYTDLGGTYSDADKTNTFNAYTTARLAQRITALENAPAGGVTSFNGRTGAITLTSSDVESVLSLTPIENAIKSLQSQIDSVAARDSYDELTATSLFVDMLAASNIYGNLHGNADSATNADTLDGQHASYFQPASTAINTGNIASQSVAYATNAGMVNNHTVNTDVPSGAVFTDTHDTNVAGTGISVSGTRGNTIAVNATYQTYIAHGEVAYDDLTTVSKALQSLQSQIDSVASAKNFDEIIATALCVDTLSAKDGHFSGNLYCVAISQTVGTSAKPWGAIYANKWYPDANNMNNYIEYTNGGFLIHGNVAATGEVAAGA